MKERRRYPRAPMTGWVEILVEGRKETLICYVSNISLGGIAIYADKMFSPGTSVVLSLHFFGRLRFESVKELKGEVAMMVEEGELSCVGIRFLKPITPESEPVLFAFLEDHYRDRK